MSSDVRFHHLEETSYKPGTELCFLQPKIESDMGQQCLVRSKHSGLSVRQSIQGAAGQDLRAATVQTPTWGGSPFMAAKIVTSLNLGLCLMHSNLLTLGCGKAKYSIYCRVQSSKNEQFMPKRPKLPDDF